MLLSMKRSRASVLFVMPILLLVLVVAGPGFGATLVAIDSGFVTEAGGSAKGDGTISGATYNYSVGRELHYVDGALFSPLVAMDRKNYFVFDLTTVTTPIVTASLEIYTGTYESVDPTELFELVAPMDVGAALFDADFLLTENGVGPASFDDPFDPAISVATAFYGNLSGGPPAPLGGALIAAALDETTISIPFSVDGIAFLNSFLGGVVVIGGTVATVVPPGSPQQPFGFTGPDIPGGDPLTPALEYTLVPEPGTAVLFGIGLLGLRLVRSPRSASGRHR